ncbi:Outer membrane receptor proteins, mostly Fe transport [Algoriella xinjiangensis]|uniref:Outer membrane receptor proteins, mostly Fe transport n=1 Tax=Algoriella xinjiangensis TaxID=684065 RepID=A0A1I4YX00_9FLAO|nr:outer membrane beta-barrel family protein [Algoriella xinjiangensis]SFN42555.1 Outer membrane receptor proteins, mostly Fe transport [Algoriella xinjiangensis]VDH16654.1 Outer membrane receptor for Fe3+-dicitrate [Algoriella xinjiangensis]
MIKFYIPLFCCIAAINVAAQQEQKGVLTYTNQTPVSLSDIIISNGEKIIDEISTDENGNFTVILEAGTYTFRIEEAGTLIYTQEVVVVQNKDIGVIIVPKTENVTLTEVAVTGQKKLIEKKVDRLVFNVDQAEGAKGGNALDALKLAPRIKVDESTDAISIIGKGSISVMINDRLMQMDATQLANYLKTIRTEDIDKIEVITNPPAKYDASGNSGIINIVLKNAKSESVNGSVSSSYNKQKYGGYNLNGNVNFRKGKWTLTSNIYNGNGKWYNNYTNKITYPDSEWTTTGSGNNINKYIGGKIGVDYEINDKLITGFNIDISDGNGTSDSNSIMNVFDFNQNKITKQITSDFDGTTWDWNYFGLNYHVINKFNKEGKKLTFDFDYSRNSYGGDDVTVSNEFDGNGVEIPNKYQGNIGRTKSFSNRYNVSIDMEQPLDSWKMNYGTRLRWAQDETDNKRLYKTTGDYSELTDLANIYQYNENIYALYYSVEKKINDKWTAKAGLRYEHAEVKGLIDNPKADYKRKYDGLYPTAYIMYQPSENHSFTLNYSRRVDRPYIWYLNPTVVKINDYSYSQGNPTLSPSNSSNFELEYAYKDLSVSSIYYRYANDVFTQVQLFDPVTKITTSKPFNFGETFSYGFSENLNFKPLKYWKVNATADVFYRKTTGKIPELNYSIDGLNGEFRITNNLDLNKKKTLFANYTYSYYTKSNDGLEKYSDYMRHNAGIRAMLFQKKLQLSFNVNNIFENKNADFSVQSNNIISQSTYEAFRSFRFGITYNFGKQFNIEKSKSNQEGGGGKG